MLSLRFLSAIVGFGILAAAVPVDTNVESQDDQGSVCQTFGVDFQQGGSYFINTNSNESFTFVSKFEGCQNDVARLMLVNMDTSDQWDCGQVPTVPDDTPQLATCQVQKNQLVSGEYLIITLGNNGNGQPLANQRGFHIDAGLQQRDTAYPTKTVTTTQIDTTTSISFINSTYTAPNPTTITQHSGTRVKTITSDPVRLTETKTITHTFDRWTKSNHITTVTATPTCHVPLRPRHPDPVCKFPYKGKDGHRHHKLEARPGQSPRRNDYSRNDMRKRSGPVDVEVHAPIQKRAPDNRTTTVSGPASGEPTRTVTAAPSTQTHVVVATTTLTITSPPKTVFGRPAQQTVTLPASTLTIVRIIYTKQYVTKTFGWTWTKTVFNTPAAEATKCRKEGGHFETWW